MKSFFSRTFCGGLLAGLLAWAPVARAQTPATVLVTFRAVVAPGVGKAPYQHLYLCGAFNKWQPGDSAYRFTPDGPGRYRLTVALPAGKKLPYCYTLGSWNVAERTADDAKVPERGLVAAGGHVQCDTVVRWDYNLHIREHYTKREYKVPMRDGVSLFTSLYVPNDSTRTYPMLLERTPYSVAPYGTEHYKGATPSMKLFAREGYILVLQDVRGRMMSEGAFENVRPYVARKTRATDTDESTDAYDTIDWLVKNVPGNNGKVGMIGISYPGFYATSGLIGSHPALKAVSPQAPVTDWFAGDDVHHNGAFFLMHTFDVIGYLNRARSGPTTRMPAPLAYPGGDPDSLYRHMGPVASFNRQYFNNEVSTWDALVQHGSYDDFWKRRTPLPHLREVKPAVLVVGGWYDAENLYGTLKTYQTLEKQNPALTNTLVMGPWAHGGWEYGEGESLGPVTFRAKTAAFFRQQVEIPFFNYYLKDEQAPNLPEAFVFETGTNAWRSFAAWPPSTGKEEKLYFSTGQELSAAPPSRRNAPDAYESDPARPVPYSAVVKPGRHRNEYMVEDQRFLAGRLDVLGYQTPVLTGDVTLAGPVAANLFVSTTGTDADFVVKLIDVYPDSAAGLGGAQLLVRAEVIRAKFRNSLEKPEPMPAGKVVRVNFALPDLLHTFRKGHRIMVQVQSSWFPLVDRNPQQFMDIYRATPADYRKAVHRIHHSRKHPSHVRFHTIPAATTALR